MAAAKETPEHQRDIAHWLMDEAQKVVNARAGMCCCAARRAAPHDPRGCRIATCVAMCAHATLVPVHQALGAPPLQWASLTSACTSGCGAVDGEQGRGGRARHAREQHGRCAPAHGRRDHLQHRQPLPCCQLTPPGLPLCALPACSPPSHARTMRGSAGALYGSALPVLELPPCHVCL